ncbi:MAG: hypothetical protein JOY72_01735 [Actinobacteria bacterium]|nr:hypothetical protein [Actinomycetota bacterium]
MCVDKVVLACDLNPDYLDYWPSARQAWLDIVGIEPLLLIVAETERVPDDLRFDPFVVPFEPIAGVHSALQAQCIRLLYPAIVDTPGAVLIADVDLYPLRRSYYLDTIRSLDERFFVSYRDVRMEGGQIAMAYNAALPSTWSEVFGVSSIDDVRRQLAEWTTDLEYDGRRAWPGWYTDQQLLYSALTTWRQAPNRWWVMDDDYTRHRQLDRLELERELDTGLGPHRRDGIRRGAYSDYICLFPYREHKEVNDLVLELALEAAG